MDSKMEPKSAKTKQKTSTKNDMILEGRFSWILLISDHILDQFSSTFYHFFKKTKKLANTVFYYVF